MHQQKSYMIYEKREKLKWENIKIHIFGGDINILSQQSIEQLDRKLANIEKLNNAII